MRSARRFWTSLALLLVVVTLLAPRAATASGSDAMAVDALPGGDVDSSRTVGGTAPFDVEIVITDASTPYGGYQTNVQWDAAVLAYDGETHLNPADLSICATPNPQGNTVWAGCLREHDVTEFAGPVERLTFHCLGPGTSPLHLITLDEDPAFATVALMVNGTRIETALADAQITCGEEGAAPTSTPTAGPSPTPGGPSPTPGGPTPTPEGPVATPTPLPPGYQAVDLAGGCNPVATTYPDGTPIQTIADAVGPAGNLAALWEFNLGAWRGFSPEHPDISDLTEADFLDALFACVRGPGAFARPIV